ncbi:MAG TPA: hypothetical protein VLN25_05755 [Burkholderiaceae bacterium]|nr:hypothetical protein [Burkholderiaceae bacterium]
MNMRHGLRNGLLVLGLVIGSVTSATAQVSIGIGLPGVSIGINMPVYPHLVPVPGYPVYYAPRVDSNYFFYDGMYWVYQSDNWYASSWYNGPWGLVAPDVVPLYVLRVPVRYYRRPPPYFHGWKADAPPRWDDHWGKDWKQRRGDWDHWDRRSAPPRAPLPTYQKPYSGNRYPHPEQQPVLQGQKYKYQPHDPVVQQHYQVQRTQGGPSNAMQGGSNARRQEQSQQGAPRHEQQSPQSAGQDRGSQGKGSAPQSAQGQDKGGGNSGQQGGENRK